MRLQFTSDFGVVVETRCVHLKNRVDPRVVRLMATSPLSLTVVSKRRYGRVLFVWAAITCGSLTVGTSHSVLTEVHNGTILKGGRRTIVKEDPPSDVVAVGEDQKVVTVRCLKEVIVVLMGVFVFDEDVITFTTSFESRVGLRMML